MCADLPSPKQVRAEATSTGCMAFSVRLRLAQLPLVFDAVELIMHHTAATHIQAMFRGIRVRELLPPPLVDGAVFTIANYLRRPTHVHGLVWDEVSFIQFSALVASDVFVTAVADVAYMEDVD